MVIIGLTGGIASGKSTVARMLQEKGALLLDADLIARDIVAPGREAWREIVHWLGEGILTPEGVIDRRRLGELVFGDEKARTRLNSITHPRIRQEMLYRIKKLKQETPQSTLVLEVPLLIESGMHKMVDLVLLVCAAPEIQLKRLQERDKLPPPQALNRLQAQMPQQEKKSFAHFLIDNGGTIQDTARQVEEFWDRAIKGEGGWQEWLRRKG